MKGKIMMALLGKIHEIVFYGVISAIVSLVCGKTTFFSLYNAGIHVLGFRTFFQAYMFWSLVIFIPVGIIGSFATKYGDGGEGLTFESDNLMVIFFAHIAEEILGIVITPFWFLKDLFTHNLDEEWKKFDYVTYLLEIIFIIIGLAVI